MKKLFVLSVILITTITAFSQNIAINSTGVVANASAMLDVSSTNTGILIPRVSLTSTSSASPVTSPATSLLVYNSATINDVAPGYYFWNGSAWVRLYSGSLNAWNLTGNAGTVPATNFIGTTDGQDFVVRTNNLERVRVLTAGNILFNRTTALYATDLFEAQGNATFPDAINGYTDQGTGNGVYGENSAIAGVGVMGLNTSATGAGTGPGVYGQSNQTGAAGVWGAGGTFTRGVLGTTTNITYAGVQGQNAAADGDGVFGMNSAAAGLGAGTGVFGQTAQGGGAAAGVYGYTDHNAGTAIIGYNNATAGTGNGKGLFGYTNQSGTSAAGVYSINAAADGEGFIAVNSAAVGVALGDAIFGTTAQSGGAGAFLTNTNTAGTGAMGAGNNSSASYLTAGSGGAFTGTLTGCYGYASSTSTTVNRYGGYFANVATDYAYVGGRNSGTQYKIIGTGTVSTIVSDVNGKKVALACPEAPEILFMDYGHGTLVNGKSHIVIDPTFAKNILVSEDHPLKVFIQLEGECNGVYVTNKTANGFDVIELQQGNSNVPFTYSIVAQRADEYDANGNLVSKNVVRFNDAPLPLETMTKETKKVNVDADKMLQPDKKSEAVNNKKIEKQIK